LENELTDLTKPIFDPNFQPMLIVKNPPNGQDPLEASAVNYYSGVTLKDLMGFTEHYALNSRLVKQDGHLVEEVYRAGTPDGKVPPGSSSRELGLAIRDLPRTMNRFRTRASADPNRHVTEGSPHSPYRQLFFDTSL
jgi:dipeptidyl-peptidase-3